MTGLKLYRAQYAITHYDSVLIAATSENEALDLLHNAPDATIVLDMANGRWEFQYLEEASDDDFYELDDADIRTEQHPTANTG